MDISRALVGHEKTAPELYSDRVSYQNRVAIKLSGTECYDFFLKFMSSEYDEISLRPKVIITSAY